MSRISLYWLAPVALAALPLGLGSAHAQGAAGPAQPDPLNAQAAVPALVHTSAFTAYRRHAEVEPIGWRDANDTVARIGGWRAYAREAAAASPAPPAPVNAAGAATVAPTGPRQP